MRETFQLISAVKDEVVLPIADQKQAPYTSIAHLEMTQRMFGAYQRQLRISFHRSGRVPQPYETDVVIGDNTDSIAGYRLQKLLAGQAFDPQELDWSRLHAAVTGVEPRFWKPNVDDHTPQVANTEIILENYQARQGDITKIPIPHHLIGRLLASDRLSQAFFPAIYREWLAGTLEGPNRNSIALLNQHGATGIVRFFAEQEVVQDRFGQQIRQKASNDPNLQIEYQLSLFEIAQTPTGQKMVKDNRQTGMVLSMVDQLTQLRLAQAPLADSPIDSHQLNLLQNEIDRRRQVSFEFRPHPLQV